MRTLFRNWAAEKSFQLRGDNDGDKEKKEARETRTKEEETQFAESAFGIFLGGPHHADARNNGQARRKQTLFEGESVSGFGRKSL